MNLLVTGSAGFIGSAFVRMLLGKNRKAGMQFPLLEKGGIVSIDKLSYSASLENLEAVKNDSRHRFFKGDIADPTLVRGLIKEHKIDWIVNFAAESHVDRSIEGSKIFAETNVMGTLNLLEAAREGGLRFLQISTDEVYGALGDKGSFTEESRLEPNSPYSASKAAADCFVRAYVHTHKLHAITTRCTNNYGPYQFPEKFLPVAITRLKQGKKIPVYGSGKNVRDWLHVEDHCAGIWLALTKGRSGEVYNFGGYGERTNIDVAKKLVKIMGREESEAIEFVEDRKGHDWRYSVDPAKSRNELGWKPQWEFEGGLEDTVKWYLENSAWWQPKL